MCPAIRFGPFDLASRQPAGVCTRSRRARGAAAGNEFACWVTAVETNYEARFRLEPCNDERLVPRRP